MFSALIKHEMKWHPKGKSNFLGRRGVLVYFLIALIIGMVFWTKSALNGTLEPFKIWYILFAFPFMLLGISTGTINREFKNNTVGWWLSLPYSRWRLVLAKFIANLWRSLLIFGLIVVLSCLSFFYAMLIDPHLYLADLLTFLQIGGNWALAILAFAPLMASLGFLMATILQSKFRKIIPIFWIGFWVLWSYVSATFHKTLHTLWASRDIRLTLIILLCIIPSWIISYLLLRLVAYALEKKISL